MHLVPPGLRHKAYSWRFDVEEVAGIQFDWQQAKWHFAECPTFSLLELEKKSKERTNERWSNTIEWTCVSRVVCSGLLFISYCRGLIFSKVEENNHVCGVTYWMQLVPSRRLGLVCLLEHRCRTEEDRPVASTWKIASRINWVRSTGMEFGLSGLRWILPAITFQRITEYPGWGLRCRCYMLADRNIRDDQFG